MLQKQRADTCPGGHELMAMSDPSGLQQLWELDKRLMETETLNLSEYSVDVGVQVSLSWLLLKSR